ncbi:MAG TPA: hypothetical protein PLO57_04200 [Candidatus Cloacimonadota bacterium]|nr:hypothetical protein [Candidatus Cloacimonadota bacterium]
MTNSARNTLVLSSLLVLSGLLAFIMLNSAKKKLEARQAETKELSQQITQLNRLVAGRDSLELEHARLMAVASSQGKVFFKEDDSINTYDYLLRVLNWLGRDVEYDFGMSDKSEGNFNEYVISGRAGYMDLVHFTRMLEYQRPVLTIEDISISAENALSDSIDFSMLFRTHFKTGGLTQDAVSYKEVKKSVHSYDLFRPRYTETIQGEEDVDPSLVNVDNSVLIAISDKRAFVRDSRGIIKILSEGDRVQWGYLYRINSRDNAVVFKIYKYGFEENQILNLINEN